MFSLTAAESSFKGGVRSDELGVESRLNRWLLVWDRCAVHNKQLFFNLLISVSAQCSKVIAK